MKSYKQALKDAYKVGVSKAEPNDFMATMVETWCKVHIGCNPELVYKGAIKKGLTAQQISFLATKDPAKFGDLMFQ